VIIYTLKINTTIPSEILVVTKHITGHPVRLKYGGRAFLEHAPNNGHDVRNQITNYIRVNLQFVQQTEVLYITPLPQGIALN